MNSVLLPQVPRGSSLTKLMMRLARRGYAGSVPATFRAAFLEKSSSSTPTYTIKNISVKDLDANPNKDKQVLVQVKYASVNYKDALAITGKGPIVRHWPMIPGCDWAGEVVESKSDKFKPGDQVVMNGWGACETHWGGFTQYLTVPATQLLVLPKPIDCYKAEALGTAGYTAMLCIQRLVDCGVKPNHGNVVVTGAAGGVGSFAVALLAAMGYKVVAMTGRVAEHKDYLTSLGASSVIDRKEYEGKPKPLNKTIYAGAVDTVGGNILANLLGYMSYSGVVAATGMAAGGAVNTSVMPFILRNVVLAGVDSVMLPNPPREKAWAELARLCTPKMIDAIVPPQSSVISMADAPAFAEKVVSGKHRGRYIVDVNK